MARAEPAPHAPSFSSVAELSEVTASVLKNKFSEVARLAARGPLAVSRHNRREFVILTAGQYEDLQQSRRAPLDNLTAEFDAMVARMNTPKVVFCAVQHGSSAEEPESNAAQHESSVTEHESSAADHESSAPEM